MKHTITMTTDVRSQNYSKVKTHNERLTDKHGNKNIDISKSYLNNGETLLDYDKLKQEHYGDHVEKVNKNRRGSEGKKNSKYKSVDDYLNRTKGSADTTFVQWFGNKEFWEEITEDLTSQGLTYEEIVNSLDVGYSRYAKGFNERNEYLKIQKWVSHHDEMAPHYQGRIFTKGLTKAGNPSKTLNSALQLEFPDVKGNNQDRMKKWRKREDTALFDELSSELLKLTKSKKVDFEISMYRKDEHGGLTMSAFKALKEVEDIKKENKEIFQKVIDKLNEREQELNEFNVSLSKKSDDLAKKSLDLDSKEVDLENKENELELNMQSKLRELREEDKKRNDRNLKKLKMRAKRYKIREAKADSYYKSLVNKNMEMIDFISEQPISNSSKNKILNKFADTHDSLRESHLNQVEKRNSKQQDSDLSL